jgi:hypothetical protein
MCKGDFGDVFTPLDNALGTEITSADNRRADTDVGVISDEAEGRLAVAVHYVVSHPDNHTDGIHRIDAEQRHGAESVLVWSGEADAEAVVLYGARGVHVGRGPHAAVDDPQRHVAEEVGAGFGGE